jgi:S1-C subfamily serine protease
VAHAAGLTSRSGVVVASVEADTPAARAGLEPGDVILTLDGEPITGVDDLVRVLNGERIGKPLPLDVLRHGGMRHLTVTPTERRQAK